MNRPDRGEAGTPGFLRPMAPRLVVRSLGPSILWSYAAAAVGAAFVGVLAGATWLGAGVFWIFDRNTDVGDAVAAAARIGLWVAGPLAIGAAVGAAAYASTHQRSFPRTLSGTGVGVVVAAGLLALGASWFAAAALATGWAVAIPADSLGRVGVRALPLVLAALLLTGAPFGSVGDLAVWQLVVVALVSPLVAAVWVGVSDAAWVAGRRLLARRASSP